MSGTENMKNTCLLRRTLSSLSTPYRGSEISTWRRCVGWKRCRIRSHNSRLSLQYSRHQLCRSVQSFACWECRDLRWRWRNEESPITFCFPTPVGELVRRLKIILKLQPPRSNTKKEVLMYKNIKKCPIHDIIEMNFAKKTMVWFLVWSVYMTCQASFK